MRSWDGITDLMDMNLSRLRELVVDRKPGVLQSMGLQRARHDLVTEQQIVPPLFISTGSSSWRVSYCVTLPQQIARFPFSDLKGQTLLLSPGSQMDTCLSFSPSDPSSGVSSPE